VINTDRLSPADVQELVLLALLGAAHRDQKQMSGTV